MTAVAPARTGSARFPATPAALVGGLWRQRQLIGELTRREVLGRYRGSALGIVWSLFHPLLTLAIFTFVFGTVFRTRWSGEVTGGADFALVLFPGMIVHALLAECLTRAPVLVTSVPNYVKKVVFPLEVLPVVAVAAAVFHALVSLLVLLLVFLAVKGTMHPSALALPFILVPFLVLTLGCAWFLAALGVYLRDVAQVMGVVTVALMFLSPVFYPASAVPVAYRGLLAWNPITVPVEQLRASLIFGQWPDWGQLAVYAAVAVAVALFGFWWFQRSRKGFADVL